MISRRGALSGIAAIATALPAAAQSQSLTDISVAIVSSTSLDWPIFVAQKRNFFRDEGLNVTIITVGGGTNTLTLLGTGSVQIASDSVNDVMAAGLHGLPLTMIAPSFQTNPYTLVTLPSINGWADLKGKTIAIGPKLNAPGVTFSRMAQAHQLTFDDFSIVITPSTNLRYAALTSGQVAATILSQPFDILAEEHGMRVLAEARDYFKVWQSEILAANSDWLRSNRPVAVRFLRAIRKATQYAYSHRDETIAALTSSMSIDPDVAAKTYDVDFRQWHAWDPDLRYNEAALNAVAEAALHGGGIREMPRVFELYDRSIAAEAVR
jgi:ABC-type nitrate/sulfonate/bicarbonate transport system substrate-binding protein